MKGFSRLMHTSFLMGKRLKRACSVQMAIPVEFTRIYFPVHVGLEALYNLHGSHE